MRIKLIVDLPIGKEHKCFKGKEYDVAEIEYCRHGRYFFKNEFGTLCGAYKEEFEIIEEK